MSQVLDWYQDQPLQTVYLVFIPPHLGGRGSRGAWSWFGFYWIQVLYWFCLRVRLFAIDSFSWLLYVCVKKKCTCCYCFQPYVKWVLINSNKALSAVIPMLMPCNDSRFFCFVFLVLFTIESVYLQWNATTFERKTPLWFYVITLISIWSTQISSHMFVHGYANTQNKAHIP